MSSWETLLYFDTKIISISAASLSMSIKFPFIVGMAPHGFRMMICLYSTYLSWSLDETKGSLD